jgi:hypothetical protein
MRQDILQRMARIMHETNVIRAKEYGGCYFLLFTYLREAAK